MRGLLINFADASQHPRWPAWVLLGAALVVSLDTALSYRALRASLDHGQAQLAKGAPRTAPIRKATPEEVAAVRETVERLGMPWDRLFAALESAASDEVALLGIEPDPKAGTVLISGDSKNYLAALTYVLNLGRIDSLSRVQLVRHELKANDPHGAVAFAVSAGWREGHHGR
jgi:hypothetical protein